MLSFYPTYSEYDRASGKVPSLFYFDGTDLFVGDTKLLDHGTLKYASLSITGNAGIDSKHRLITAFRFQ